MKKKILLLLFILVGVFTITGCVGDNGELSDDGRKKETFVDLKYLEPKNYSNVLDYGSDDNKTKNYIYGQADGSISLSYKKGKDYSEMENLYHAEHTEKEINGTTWRVMDNDDVGVISKFYYTVYNDNLYIIELNGIDKYPEEMNDFVDNMSLK